MKFVAFVLFPLLFQVLAALGVISMHKIGGEFVGLWVMLSGMVAIPLTALFNWLRLRAQPPLHFFSLANRTIITTAIYPVLCILLFIFAS